MDVFLDFDIVHWVLRKLCVVSVLENYIDYVQRNVFLASHAFLIVLSGVFFSRQQTRQNLSMFMKQRETTFAFSRMVLVVLSVSLLSRFSGVIAIVFYNVQRKIISQ